MAHYPKNIPETISQAERAAARAATFLSRDTIVSSGAICEVNEDECIGCGSCEDICPEVFKLNKETEKSIVTKPEGGPEELIQEAMLECPMSCIFWD